MQVQIIQSIRELYIAEKHVYNVTISPTVFDIFKTPNSVNLLPQNVYNEWDSY